MTILLPTLAVAFAAFCLWLGVRIFNRRERWAKRTALGLSVLLAYPLSIGPACWISSRANVGASAVSTAYRPLTWVMSQNEIADAALSWYSEIGAAVGWGWFDGSWDKWDGLDKWLYSPKYRAINRNLGID